MELENRVNKLEYEMSTITILSKKIDKIDEKVDSISNKWTDVMENTIRETMLLNKKIDMYIVRSEELCKLRHKQIDEHLGIVPIITDKIAILWNWFPIQWGMIILILSGILGAFWVLLKK